MIQQENTVQLYYLFINYLLRRKSNKENLYICSIKVWDVEDLIATYSYNYAHTRPITSTDVKPMCNSIFVSAASSGDALLWDIRRSKPAHCMCQKIVFIFHLFAS